MIKTEKPQKYFHTEEVEIHAPRGAINREEKGKTLRNREYAMKYPWIRDGISMNI